MSCASCTANIEKVLNKTNGVISASANFPLEKAVVEFDSFILNINKL
jgi:Cu+-exporting ATPase